MPEEQRLFYGDADTDLVLGDVMTGQVVGLDVLCRECSELWCALAWDAHDAGRWATMALN